MEKESLFMWEDEQTEEMLLELMKEKGAVVFHITDFLYDDEGQKYVGIGFEEDESMNERDWLSGQIEGD